MSKIFVTLPFFQSICDHNKLENIGISYTLVKCIICVYPQNIQVVVIKSSHLPIERYISNQSNKILLGLAKI